MRVRVIDPGSAHNVGVHLGAAAGPAPACWADWRPALTLGATSAGGLMLPDARPSAATLYAPRGVWIDAHRLIVCDTGNHRVLIWSIRPDRSGAEADVVLGQRDAVSEGPAMGGESVAAGMNLPTGVLIDQERLVVADAWHHRLLVWDRIPERTGTPPDHVIGQPDADSSAPNRAAEPTASSFYWPFGIALVDGRFYVADTGNRRLLVWDDGLPLDGRPADRVIGQPDAGSREENRGGSAGRCSFRWPHAIAGTGRGGIYVADAGNHRVLRWDRHPDTDTPADGVIGQPDFSSSSEFPYTSQEGRLRFPYAVVGPGLAVADTANNRVLIWDEPADGAGIPGAGTAPQAALAQPDFASAGENRWEAVAEDTLCWPYGLSRHGDTLAVADSGNNRVTIWQRQQDG